MKEIVYCIVANPDRTQLSLTTYEMLEAVKRGARPFSARYALSDVDTGVLLEPILSFKAPSHAWARLLYQVTLDDDRFYT